MVMDSTAEGEVSYQRFSPAPKGNSGAVFELQEYRRTSISGTKKAQITFPLRHFFPLKVFK
jgi:hypothetical protein